ncbi:MULTISPECIES: hypothetical protein [Crocosphaera]|uniref:Uncharacterized protein n=2 Tax=Crocosphaera watsonii TaxID=263511 RepID=T2JWK4_CROWT|nr:MULTISPECIES: hypothetical protein [Crocosphaera]EHJ09783.1 hypothetical protein CWATWH0003_5456 [Crocosphaera watsonii WH 0003]MCH2243216.1 hypothetical protein [Crocosphaera sp.]CCQ69391.1 hypothetical protein CWATWH0402_3605 [Crocosphaera watsonii WH 0402]
MKRQTKVIQSHKSLLHRLSLSLLKYYPWLLVTAIASLFFFPSALLTPVSLRFFRSNDHQLETA